MNKTFYDIMDTTDKSIYDFDLFCDEMVASKYILADRKISQILKCIAGSRKLYDIIDNCMQGFDFGVALARSKNQDENGINYLIPPKNRSHQIAFVFCLLFSFDTNQTDFKMFLHTFYYHPSNPNIEFSDFTAHLIMPFKANILKEFNSEPLEDFAVALKNTVTLQDEYVENIQHKNNVQAYPKDFLSSKNNPYNQNIVKEQSIQRHDYSKDSYQEVEQEFYDNYQEDSYVENYQEEDEAKVEFEKYNLDNFDYSSNSEDYSNLNYANSNLDNINYENDDDGFIEYSASKPKYSLRDEKPVYKKENDFIPYNTQYTLHNFSEEDGFDAVGELDSIAINSLNDCTSELIGVIARDITLAVAEKEELLVVCDALAKAISHGGRKSIRIMYLAALNTIRCSSIARQLELQLSDLVRLMKSYNID